MKNQQEQVKDWNSFFIIVVVLFIIWQFVIGSFIRKSCHDNALSMGLATITEVVFQDDVERRIGMDIYEAYKYHRCINKWLLLNIERRHTRY